MSGIFGPFTFLRSQSDATVRVHETDEGKIRVYEKWGWVRYQPTVRTLSDLIEEATDG